MTDLHDRMRRVASLGAALKLLDEAADRIELLEGLLREARPHIVTAWYEPTEDPIQTLFERIDAALGDRHERPL